MCREIPRKQVVPGREDTRYDLFDIMEGLHKNCCRACASFQIHCGGVQRQNRHCPNTYGPNYLIVAFLCVVTFNLCLKQKNPFFVFFLFFFNGQIFQ